LEAAFTGSVELFEDALAVAESLEPCRFSVSLP